MNLILLERNEVSAKGEAELRGRRAQHLEDVIGVEVGQRLRVGVIGGKRGQAEVLEVEAGRVVLATELREGASPRPGVDLILAMPRPKALRRLLGAVAAMGVGQIEIVNAWRVDKSYLSSPLLEQSALRAALVLGCEQGATTWLPGVRVHRRLMACVEELRSDDARMRVIAEPGVPSIDALHPMTKASRVLLAIGPEGGWIERELDTFTELNFRALSLGSGVLRVETAVVAALAQLDLLKRLGLDHG